MLIAKFCNLGCTLQMPHTLGYTVVINPNIKNNHFSSTWHQMLHNMGASKFGNTFKNKTIIVIMMAAT